MSETLTSRRGEFMPPHPGSDHIFDSYPFKDIVESYTKDYQDMHDPDLLDEIALGLHESEFMKDLEEQLSTSPKFSGLYRFDPWTLGSRNGWEGQQMATGAKTTWLRVFEDLTFDKVWVERIEDEALVVINHPSTLVSSKSNMVKTEEPTVLFTSQQLNISHSETEELAWGSVFKHGDLISHAMPRESIANPYVVSECLYYYFLKRQAHASEAEQRNQ